MHLLTLALTLALTLQEYSDGASQEIYHITLPEAWSTAPHQKTFHEAAKIMFDEFNGLILFGLDPEGPEPVQLNPTRHP